MDQHNETEAGELFDVENPYRAIRGWFLSDSNGKRVPVPPLENMRQAINSETVLHGWLQPTGKNKNAKPVYCSIPNLQELAFDRSKDFRGFWAMRPSDEGSNLPIYWLQEPDLNVYAEEELLQYRAFIGVISNIHDLINREPATAKKSVARVLKDFPDAFSEALLHKYRNFCAAYLKQSLPGLTERCAFLVSIRKLKSTSAMNAQKELALTKEAEARSKQYPWGQSILSESMNGMASLVDTVDVSGLEERVTESAAFPSVASGAAETTLIRDARSNKRTENQEFEEFQRETKIPYIESKRNGPSEFSTAKEASRRTSGPNAHVQAAPRAVARSGVPFRQPEKKRLKRTSPTPDSGTAEICKDRDRLEKLQAAMVCGKMCWCSEEADRTYFSLRHPISLSRRLS